MSHPRQASTSASLPADNMREVIIIHGKNDIAQAQILKERILLRGQRLRVILLDVLSSVCLDSQSLEECIIEKCKEGAICLFYITYLSLDDCLLNQLKNSLLLLSLHTISKFVAPVGEDSKISGLAPYGLSAYLGMMADDVRIHRKVHLMLEKLQ